MIILNFSNNNYNNYKIGFPYEGEWICRFNSDSKKYSFHFNDVGIHKVIALHEAYD